MSYIQGFVVPVKPGQKEAYRAMAGDMAPLFAEFGATCTVECWGEDVPDGKRTDFKRAVKAQDGEHIVFSWIVWPDKATCDAAAEQMQSDERMKPSGDMPFDMQRMIYAGFDVAQDSGGAGAFGWIDAMVASVPSDKRQAFVDHAAWMGDKLMANGALRIVNGWGADVPDGKTTDFKRAVEAADGETVTFGWIEWPDKATHDSGWGAVMAEGAMQQHPPVWDGQRAIFGGFAPILDTDHA
jgi:uncharacterized protein YbaA (DUF1428 family)